jgi:hypothetical protein
VLNSITNNNSLYCNEPNLSRRTALFRWIERNRHKMLCVSLPTPLTIVIIILFSIPAPTNTFLFSVCVSIEWNATIFLLCVYFRKSKASVPGATFHGAISFWILDTKCGMLIRTFHGMNNSILMIHIGR